MNDSAIYTEIFDEITGMVKKQIYRDMFVIVAFGSDSDMFHSKEKDLVWCKVPKNPVIKEKCNSIFLVPVVF